MGNQGRASVTKSKVLSDLLVGPVGVEWWRAKVLTTLGYVAQNPALPRRASNFRETRRVVRKSGLHFAVDLLRRRPVLTAPSGSTEPVKTF